MIPVCGMEGFLVSSQKSFKTLDGAQNWCTVHPKSFTFLDKKSGTRRFEVKANADGSMPIDQAVGLLVVHCLMREPVPNDFTVMVAAGENLFDGLKQRAKKLMHACQGTQAFVQLTRRQREVLRGVLQPLSNKEIAVKLNILERTVKFHVSALLAKFGVVSRTSLIQKVSEVHLPLSVPNVWETPYPAATRGHGMSQEQRNLHNTVVQLTALERRSRV
jgi:DNA-binding CsgD family transcriptional regulator